MATTTTVTCDRCDEKIQRGAIMLEVSARRATSEGLKPFDLCENCQKALDSWMASVRNERQRQERLRADDR